MADEEAGVGAGQVGLALPSEQGSVNAHVAQHHLQAVLECLAYDFAVAHFGVLGKGDAVRQGPGVALPGDGAELVSDGEALFVGGDDNGEELAGELVPKVIEEILHRSAGPPVIVGRAQQDDIGALYASLEFGVARQVVGRVGIVKGQGFFLEVEYIHRAAVRAELPGRVMDDGAGDRFAVEAAYDRENGYWLRHGEEGSSEVEGVTPESARS